MKKILLLSTGGTIASRDQGDGLTPSQSGQALIAQVPEIGTFCEVDAEELMSIDSSNLQPEDWVRMAEAVDAHLSAYDGFVITHGTDTMAYSSCMLSWMLQGIPKPVILTGSQIPMGQEDSDAPGNLLLAFQAACSDLRGVCLAFDGIVIRGVFACKVRSRSKHAFESINAPVAARLENGRLVLNGQPVWTKPYQLNTSFSNHVLIVHPAPGLEPDFLRRLPEQGYQAVILAGYGLGGIPDLGRSLSDAVEELCQKGVTVVLSTQCLYEGVQLDVYEVGVRAARAGALSGGMLTREALYTKLMWVLGQTDRPEQIRQLFFTDLAGELQTGKP